MAAEEWRMPDVPPEPQQEGGRWRFHRPVSSTVAEWFGTQRIDDDLDYKDYVGGVVLISQSEKVKYTRPDGFTVERHEQVYVPYIQIGTRVGYFHRLAEVRELVPVIEPVKVPRASRPESPYFNANMGEGLWWHVVMGEQGQALRYLCSTWRVALYDPVSYRARLLGDKPMPVREGRGTKQVAGGTDPNGIAKAETGAVGRALGVAGILVIGTGIASAEDMMELPGYGAQPPSSDAATLPTVPSEIAPGEQPPPVDATEQLDSLRSRVMALQAQLQEETPEGWREFVAWWAERKKEEGWETLQDAPLEGLKAVVAKMESVAT